MIFRKGLIARLMFILLSGVIALQAYSADQAQAEQRPKKEAKSSAKVSRTLTRLSTVDIPTEVASEFRQPLRCDRAGNLYLHSDTYGVTGYKKISPKGERVASFNPNPDSHLKVDGILSLALGRGDLYALVYAHEIKRYLFVYDEDGRYKSTIKLDPGFAWQPRALAVFPSGEILITGSRYVRNTDDQVGYAPFTGMFKSDGTLLKEVTISEDEPLQKLADAGDKRYANPRAPGLNRAIELSQTDVGDDGNLYLMRWTSPAKVIVISSLGEPVRSFSVDSGDAEMQPIEMHISGNRIAVLFLHPQAGNSVMKVVDLEGRDIATYAEPADTPERLLGTAFACYDSQQERFTFLSTTDKNTLQLTIAQGR